MGGVHIRPVAGGAVGGGVVSQSLGIPTYVSAEDEGANPLTPSDSGASLAYQFGDLVVYSIGLQIDRNASPIATPQTILVNLDFGAFLFTLPIVTQFTCSVRNDFTATPATMFQPVIGVISAPGVGTQLQLALQAPPDGGFDFVYNTNDFMIFEGQVVFPATVT